MAYKSRRQQYQEAYQELCRKHPGPRGTLDPQVESLLHVSERVFQRIYEAAELETREMNVGILALLTSVPPRNIVNECQNGISEKFDTLKDVLAVRIIKGKSRKLDDPDFRR